MHKNLIPHIRNFVYLTEQEVSVFNKLSLTHHLKKKEFLQQEGRICRQIFFVEKGCLRMYFINKNGVEQITQFALEGWWISDYLSFTNDLPSEYSIQAVEESRIVSIDNPNFELLLREIPQLERYFRTMMLKAVAGAQLRSKLLYEMSKEEFYLHFSTSFPEFMLRVPQYMIASYLGLTPEYLSELRRKRT